MRTAQAARPPLRGGFTILELIFVITAILILVSLVFVGVHHLTGAANRTSSAGALRQLITAWSGYTADNEGRLLPGYIDPADFSNPAHPFYIGTQASPGPFYNKVRNENGGPLVDADCSSYVWRLAPYLSYNMKIFSADYKSREVVEKLDNEILSGKYGPGTVNPAAGEFGVALIPSFGLNSIFVGGDDYHGEAWATQREPWVRGDNPGGEVLAATRFSEIKNASNLIVFGPSAQTDPGNTSVFPQVLPPPVAFGSPELRPPYLDYDENTGYWDLQQWFLDANNTTDAKNDLVARGGDFIKGGGIPISRWGDGEFPAAHADGSVFSHDTRDYTISSTNTADQTAAVIRHIMASWWPKSTGLN